MVTREAGNARKGANQEKKEQSDVEQEFEQFNSNKLVICRNIEIAEKSIADGNMEFEVIIRTKSINCDRLAAAQNMISMGFKRKAVLSQGLGALKKDINEKRKKKN